LSAADGAPRSLVWRRYGLVYRPPGSVSWARHSCLQPTPFVLDDAIRVFVGMRDEYGRSSVGWVDVDRHDPSLVRGVSSRPALSPGWRGAFDDAGVVPCAIVSDEGRLRLYYAGYQRPPDVRFRAFGGVAWSNDGGNTFQREVEEAVMGPTAEASDFRVPHCVRPGERWRVWYGAGGSWRQGRTKTLPVYDIRYTESKDGMSFPDSGKTVLEPTGAEHRVGRPQVVERGGWHLMFYGFGSEDEPYRLGLARSSTGSTWTREDASLGIEPSSDGWDSQMTAYPGLVEVDGRLLLFYNGNDYGRTGFGCAELIDG
jgi:hypothetical protein